MIGEVGEVAPGVLDPVPDGRSPMDDRARGDRGRAEHPRLVRRVVDETAFVAVGRAEDVPPGTIRHFTVGETAVAVANIGGELHALEGKCLHLGGPIGRGRFDGRVVSCPFHGWQYDVTTGENEFDRAIRLERYDVEVVDGEVRVALPRA